MNRFARPDEITIPLTHGDTLTIRREITHGEWVTAMERASEVLADGRVIRRPMRTGTALVVLYLIDWTLKDFNEQKIPIRGLSVDDLTAVVNSLLPPDFVEVKEAIEAHEAAMSRERSRPEGPAPSVPTSLSLVGAGGAMSGSET